jgi:hypothetical protein
MSSTPTFRLRVNRWHGTTTTANITTDPMEREQAMDLLRSLPKSLGLTMTNTGGGWRVCSGTKGTSTPVRLDKRPNGQIPAGAPRPNLTGYRRVLAWLDALEVEWIVTNDDDDRTWCRGRLTVVEFLDLDVPAEAR